MEKTSDRGYYLFGLRIVADFGATIAVPIVVFAWLGQRLDARWGTKPWLLIAGFVLAAFISGISIYRKAKVYGNEYQKLTSQKSNVKSQM